MSTRFSLPTSSRPSAFQAALIGGYLGRTRMFGPDMPLFLPEEEGEEPRLTRAQWVKEEQARQAQRSVDQLAHDNAELKWDLQSRKKQFDPQTQVAVPKADHEAATAELAAYRALYPTPKEAEAARTQTQALEAKDKARSYDEARLAALAEYPDLPAAFHALIPTAEQAKDRPDAALLLGSTDFIKGEVAKIAAAHGTNKRDTASNTDTGTPPNTVKPAQTATGEAEGKTAAQGYYARFQPKKE